MNFDIFQKLKCSVDNLFWQLVGFYKVSDPVFHGVEDIYNHVYIYIYLYMHVNSATDLAMRPPDCAGWGSTTHTTMFVY